VTYGYRPEDITVLKDDPALAIHLQPTRENIVSAFFFLVLPWPDLYGTDFGLLGGL
jgi:hypothetical protein